MENKELGRLVLKQIDTHPQQFNMDIWVSEAPCGTTACLAGWTLLMSGWMPVKVTVENCEVYGFVSPGGEVIQGEAIGDAAQTVLGMTNNERVQDYYGDVFYLDDEDAIDAFKDLSGLVE